MKRAARSAGARVEASRALTSRYRALPFLNGERADTTAEVASLTCSYVSISSCLMSPRIARPGARWKKRHADPANGSTYRECSCDQYLERRAISLRLLPAQRRNG